MPKSSKPIACICGSRSIKWVSFSLYLNPEDYGQILTGGATGVDTLAEKWARQHGIGNTKCMVENTHRFNAIKT